MQPIIITILICLTVLICMAGVTAAAERIAKLKYWQGIERAERNKQ